MDTIINKVTQSSLITLDLEDYCDPSEERVIIDIKDQLFQGLILREKDFRTYIKETDWSEYEGKYVAITCSEEVIIPTWAFMLLSTALGPYAKWVRMGDMEGLNHEIFCQNFDKLDLKAFQDARMVIKGCGNFKIPDSCYVYAVSKLQPYIQSVMYGEPCSTVPVFKRKKIKK